VGVRAASHRARDKNVGALMSILSAYEDQFPVAGKSKHKEAIPRGCEKPPKVTRSTTE